MRIRTSFATALLLVSSCLPALAAATEDGAADLRNSLQVYLSTTPGLVDVKPSGEDYIVTIDPNVLLAKVPEPGFTSKADPFVMTVRPLGNGHWSVSQSGPYNIMFSAPNSMTIDAKIASYDWSGVFDANIAAFLSSEYKLSGLTMSQTVVDPNGIKTSAATSMESWTGTSAGVGRADGAVDMTGTQLASAMTVASKMELTPEQAASMPPIDYTATVASYDSTSDIKGFRAKAILDLVAWFVARPSKELILRDQVQLKEKIAAALPLWDRVDAGGAYKGLSVSTMLGQFAVASIGANIGMSGAVKDGLFREAIGFEGLTIPAGIAPPWTEGLIPTKFNIDFSATGFDLKAPVDVALQNADFSKDPPINESLQPLLLAAFAPTNSVGLKFEAGEITSPTYSITYDGVMTANFMGLPTGTANIRMKGLDAVIAKVQSAAATDPNAQQGMAVLVAAKGFGKAEPDGSTLWVIDGSAPGKLLINGVDMSAFMGAPPAQ